MPQLVGRLSGYPIIYKVYRFQVVQDFVYQQYVFQIPLNEMIFRNHYSENQRFFRDGNFKGGLFFEVRFFRKKHVVITLLNFNTQLFQKK